MSNARTQVASGLWLLAVASSLTLGGYELAGRLRAIHPVPFSAAASTDSILAGSYPGLSSASLSQQLATVEPGDVVLFAGVEGDPAAKQLHFSTSLLAVPRQVAAVACPAEGGPGYVVVPFDPERRITAVVYFGISAPAANAVRLADGVSWLRVEPVAANSQWTSLCHSSPSPSS